MYLFRFLVTEVIEALDKVLMLCNMYITQSIKLTNINLHQKNEISVHNGNDIPEEFYSNFYSPLTSVRKPENR